jgi:uncharacterized protein
MPIRIVTLAALLAALALAPLAGAHVTLNPQQAAAGAFTELLVRVPNERDNANTIKVDVKFPDGFVFASYAPVPGWTVEVKRQKLAQPIVTDDGEISEQVSEMIWTGDGTVGKIAPGQFMDFPISVQIPGDPGDTLTFPALQTYDNGEVVRWIGPADADEPAPQVAVTAGSEEGTSATGSATGSQAAAATPAAESSDGRDTLTLVLAIAGLAAALATLALVLLRQRRA